MPKEANSVRFIRDIDSDVIGMDLSIGMNGIVHRTPRENLGLYEILVDGRLYDIDVNEIERCLSSEDEKWSVGRRIWNEALVLSKKGKAKLAKTKIWEAISIFKSVSLSSSDEHRDEKYSNRNLFTGICLIDAGSSGEALHFLHRSIDSEKRNCDAMKELVHTMEERGELERARTLVSNFVASSPNCPWIDPLGFQRAGFISKKLLSFPFWDIESDSRLEWIHQLENQSKVVIRELISLQKQKNLQPWFTVGGSHRTSGRKDGSVLTSGEWKEIVLVSGKRKDNSLGEHFFPETIAMLKNIAQDAVDLAERGAGEIILSKLSANTKISPHCAPHNLRLTCHLGLDIPEDSECCRIRVGNEWRTWKKSKCLVFDDSFEHEVENNSLKKERIILLLRFWHPDLSHESVRSEALNEMFNERERELELRSTPPR
eukprot:g5402.t1